MHDIIHFHSSFIIVRIILLSFQKQGWVKAGRQRARLVAKGLGSRGVKLKELD